MKKNLSLILIFLILSAQTVYVPCFSADDGKTLTGQVSDPLVEAQEKLLHAKGSYKTIKAQESAIEDMRRATNLSLKAAKLRAKAEKLQSRADLLVNKANQQALSRGLYITNPLAPVKMQSPPAAQKTASAPAIYPVPGQPVNIIIPKQEEVSYEDSNGSESPPVPGF